MTIGKPKNAHTPIDALTANMEQHGKDKTNNAYESIAGWLSRVLPIQSSKTWGRLMKGSIDVRLSLVAKLAQLVGLEPHDLINPYRIGCTPVPALLLQDDRSYRCTLWLDLAQQTDDRPDRDLLVARHHNGIWFAASRHQPALGRHYTIRDISRISATPEPAPELITHLVSSNADWLRTQSAYLERRGYRVLAHSSVDDCLDQMIDPPGAVVIDASPHYADELARSWLRRTQQRSQRQTPVLFAAASHAPLDLDVLPYNKQGQYLVTARADDIERVLRQILSINPGRNQPSEPYSDELLIYDEPIKANTPST